MRSIHLNHCAWRCRITCRLWIINRHITDNKVEHDISISMAINACNTFHRSGKNDSKLFWKILRNYIQMRYINEIFHIFCKWCIHDVYICIKYYQCSGNYMKRNQNNFLLRNAAEDWSFFLLDQAMLLYLICLSTTGSAATVSWILTPLGTPGCLIIKIDKYGHFLYHPGQYPEAWKLLGTGYVRWQ